MMVNPPLSSGDFPAYQVLDTCTTNANIGILVSNIDGVRLTVAGSTMDLKSGEPVGLDFCLEASCSEEQVVGLTCFI